MFNRNEYTPNVIFNYESSEGCFINYLCYILIFKGFKSYKGNKPDYFPLKLNDTFSGFEVYINQLVKNLDKEINAEPFHMNAREFKLSFEVIERIGTEGFPEGPNIIKRGREYLKNQKRENEYPNKKQKLNDSDNLKSGSK